MRYLAPALLLTLLLAGCSLGPGSEQSGDVSLTVTKDFGAKQLERASNRTFPDGETVMRYLQRTADNVDTTYGGKFVNSIDGVSGSDNSDWFYYVNGIEAEVGAAEYELSPGDRAWWDHHRWDNAMRIPAVVGSFPEPFIHGERGKRFPVRVDCASDAEAACDRLERALEDAGIAPSKAALGSVTGENVLRFVVGTWKQVRVDKSIAVLEQGPARSGVFARPVENAAGQYDFELLRADGSVARTLGAGGGLLAATRFKDQAPAWEVTGTDAAGLDRAVALVRAGLLRNRFAIASDGAPIALPVGDGGRGA